MAPEVRSRKQRSREGRERTGSVDPVVQEMGGAERIWQLFEELLHDLNHHIDLLARFVGAASCKRTNTRRHHMTHVLSERQSAGSGGREGEGGLPSSNAFLSSATSSSRAGAVNKRMLPSAPEAHPPAQSKQPPTQPTPPQPTKQSKAKQIKQVDR